MKAFDHAQITAAELVRNFSGARRQADTVPLFITNHGRSTHVLLSIADYHALASGEDGARTKSGGAEVAEILSSISEWIDEGVIASDDQGRILYANRVAIAALRRSIDHLVGEPVDAVLDLFDAPLLNSLARRTIEANEANTAEIQSPFRQDGWLKVRSFPIMDVNVLTFDDITDEVTHHRLADVKSAILAAMRLHDDLSFAQVNLRGVVVCAWPGFSKMLGIDEARLVGVSFPDLVTAPDKPVIRTALEQALGENIPAFAEVRMITAGIGERDARIAIAPLKGAYGAEGAVIICRLA